MHDRVLITAGLAVFLVLVAFPFWYPGVSGETASPPDLEAPEGARLFTAPWSDVGGDAESSIAWDALGEAFRRNKVTLSGEAGPPTRGAEGDRWRIVDGECRYLVLRKQDTVEVYAGCVEDREVMKATHMNMLITWREAVIRSADKSQVEVNGKKYPKSLTKCCMTCHTSRERFCARCHEYANILQIKRLPDSATAQGPRRGIRCWNCHLERRGD